MRPTIIRNRVGVADYFDAIAYNTIAGYGNAIAMLDYAIATHRIGITSRDNAIAMLDYANVIACNANATACFTMSSIYNAVAPEMSSYV